MTTVEVSKNGNRLGWAAVLFTFIALLFIACSVVPTVTPTPPQPTATPFPVANVPTSGSDAAPPAEVQEHPGGASGFSHFVFEQVGDHVVTSLVEGPPGTQVRARYSFPALQQLLESGKSMPDELQMSHNDLETLVGQLEALHAATEKYRDVNVAIADGYKQRGGVVPNMGAHFVHEDRVMDGSLNVEEPEILIYDQDEAGNWLLVGTSLVLPWQMVGDEHPDGFAGSLDNWHVHYDLCELPDGGFRTAPAEECQAAGGNFNESYGWMIHAWVYDDNPLGVFSMWNSNIPPFMPEDTIRQTRQADSRTVIIKDFELSTIEIKVGESITWMNVDRVPHTVTSGSSGVASPGFESELLGPGHAFTFRFDQPGRFPFTCSLHPQMNGTVLVEPGL